MYFMSILVSSLKAEVHDRSVDPLGVEHETSSRAEAGALSSFPSRAEHHGIE